MERALLDDGVTLYDPTHWWTKFEAAERLGVTTRTIERWAKAGTIKTHYYQPPYQNKVAVYDRAELEEAAARTKDKPVSARREPSYRPTDSAPTSQENQALMPRPTSAVMSAPTDGPTVSVVAAFLPVILEKGVYVTQEEAVNLTNWSPKYLKQAAAEGRIRKGPGRQVLYRTIDLLLL
jgi:hypothetical protein